MRRLGIFLTLVGVIAALVAMHGRPAFASARTAASLGSSPVVVELYTSQGCSSCPPAERLLSRIGTRMHRRVIPLAFHVDYWNHDGWRDPFSSPRWSARQITYDHILGLRAVYTPQAIIDGTSQCIGSDRTVLLNRIESVHDPAGTVQIRVSPVPPGSRKIRVHVEARLTHSLARAQKVMLVLYQSGLVTPVSAGENRGATLRNDFVVRTLVRVFTLGAAAGSRRAGDFILRIDPSWNAAELGVAAFIQDPATMEISGAASAAVTAAR